MTMRRRSVLAGGALSALVTQARSARDQPPAAAVTDWARIVALARGQTVYFSAWAGSARINAYLQWAAAELDGRFGVQLQHVKIADTAEVVTRLRAERAVGRVAGSTDMVWINGKHFHRLKREGLLFGPFAEQLPSYALVDARGKASTRIDFAEPVDGMEAPWGMAQLTFYADRTQIGEQPRSAAELLAWAEVHPGRFTYPRPPELHGSAFLKQMLSEVVAERDHLLRPVDAARFDAETAPLWDYLGRLHKALWREGKQFPTDTATMRQMLAGGELVIGLTFNPNEAANEIAAGRLPRTVFSYQHAGGTIGNTHFLAVPFNARSKEAAQVAINFLLSPLAQARKADLAYWGDPTVLDVQRLPDEQKAWFAGTPLAGAVVDPAPVLPEPHASWVVALESEWQRRYGGT